MYLQNFSEPKANVKIFDATGKLVYKSSLSISGSVFTQINTQLLARGLYVLKIEAGNSIKFAKKILKQ